MPSLSRRAFLFGAASVAAVAVVGGKIVDAAAKAISDEWRQWRRFKVTLHIERNEDGSLKSCDTSEWKEIEWTPLQIKKADQ